MWERRMHESRRRTPEDLQRGGVCKMSRILRILYLCKKNGQKPECSSKAGGKSGLFEYLLHRKDLTFSQAWKKVDADIGDMEKVTVSGALKGLKSTLKDCAKISSLLERCKSWRPRLRLKKRRRVEAENKKLGDYSH